MQELLRGAKGCFCFRCLCGSQQDRDSLLLPGSHLLKARAGATCLAAVACCCRELAAASNKMFWVSARAERQLALSSVSRTSPLGCFGYLKLPEESCRLPWHPQAGIVQGSGLGQAAGECQKLSVKTFALRREEERERWMGWGRKGKQLEQKLSREGAGLWLKAGQEERSIPQLLHEYSMKDE